MSEVNFDTASISELLDSLNASIQDIREHPTDNKELPSNFEILARGFSDSKALDFLFSTKLDKVVEGLFKDVSNGNFDRILENTSSLTAILDSFFGEGSFRGPIGQSVLNNIQGTMTSIKYQTMKSFLGKTVTNMKKTRLILKNLDQGKHKFDYDPVAKEKYLKSVYAIKQLLKVVARIYHNRKLINQKVYDGIHNIVHEDYYVDEALI